MKFDDPSAFDQFMKMGRPGVYFRVLKEVELNVGDELKLIDREAVLVSVLEIFEMGSKPDVGRLREILKVVSLNERMREKYQAYVDGA